MKLIIDLVRLVVGLFAMGLALSVFLETTSRMINFNNTTNTRTKTYWNKQKALRRLVHEAKRREEKITKEQKDYVAKQ